VRGLDRKDLDLASCIDFAQHGQTKSMALESLDGYLPVPMSLDVAADIISLPRFCSHVFPMLLIGIEAIDRTWHIHHCIVKLRYKVVVLYYKIFCPRCPRYIKSCKGFSFDKSFNVIWNVVTVGMLMVQLSHVMSSVFLLSLYCSCNNIALRIHCLY
jgi:hypothetical protein